jgi:SAM-dependent methyltransferase
MNDSEYDWSWQDFFEATRGKKLSKTLQVALEKYNFNANASALDLGTGTGRDALHLLKLGFNVTATDAETSAIDMHLEDVPEELGKNLSTHVCRFSDFTYGSYELVNASLSLFFQGESDFSTTWNSISESLSSGGVFAGNFLGINDDWTSRWGVTGHTREQTQELLSDFSETCIDEEEWSGATARGDSKHWHLFNIVAVK